MNDLPGLSEDDLERRRSLLIILQYVRDECERAGYSLTGRLVAHARGMLEGEPADERRPRLGRNGQPPLH